MVGVRGGDGGCHVCVGGDEDGGDEDGGDEDGGDEDGIHMT